MNTIAVAYPVCGTPIIKRVVGCSVEIAFCDWRGVWLDAGELERPLAPPDAGNSAQVPGIGTAVVHGFSGAAAMGSGFSIGQRLVGGIIDELIIKRS